MEQCYFSFMLFGRYFQLTKARVFHILANKDGWKIIFKIDFKKKKNPEKPNSLARCRRLRYPTIAMAEKIDIAEKMENQEPNSAYMECVNCGTPVNENERCHKCNCGISKPHAK